ncbi:hypothetical protein N9033_00100 [bacterium]|nr:hypothetical protein [bacterium]
MKDKYITGILNKYIGIKDIAIADLSVYLDKPVGVGEHGDLGLEIERKIKEINKCDEVIDTINRYFSTKQEDDSDTK